MGIQILKLNSSSDSSTSSRVPVSGGRAMHCRIDSQKKVSTNSTRSQEQNNQNKEFTKKNYAGFSEDLRNMKSCMDLAPKCHLKASA